MTPLEAYRDFWLGGFRYSGRTSRPAFWWAALGNAVVFAAITVAVATVGSVSSWWSGAMQVVFWVVYIAMWVASLPLHARRLHDAGHSGWWTILVMLLAWPVGSLVVGLMPTESGNNRWGMDRAADRTAEVFD